MITTVISVNYVNVPHLKNLNIQIASLDFNFHNLKTMMMTMHL